MDLLLMYQPNIACLLPHNAHSHYHQWLYFMFLIYTVMVTVYFLYIVCMEAVLILYSGWIIFFLSHTKFLLCFSLVYSFTSSFDNEDDDNNTLKYKRETLIILLVIVIIVFKYYLAINRRKDAIKSSSWNGEGSWTSEKPWLGTSKCGFYTSRVSWVWEQQDSSTYKLWMYDKLS